MEYDFIREKTGQYSIELSMGHEALANWINTEITDNQAQVEQILTTIHDLKSKLIREKSIIGKEYSLYLTMEDAEVMANSLHFQTEELGEQYTEENLSEDEDMSRSICGTDDLQYLLEEWLDFIRHH
ncbi:YacL family protein [Oceanospirillum sediminis]|uniref:YacL family protein n=1 Tax=Oceanospirillum sediminis TaxID=2760088 RepID=A0A839IUC0_9GAMM|nr:YacL family protein [Oceanospirillum sediminis]MBB1488531.1 YacL family protein [Oceanospirillum sediminis]